MKNKIPVKLTVDEFGNGMFKINLPSRADATFGLFYAIEKKTTKEISLEDDGYILIKTKKMDDVEKVKKAAESYLNKLQA